MNRLTELIYSGASADIYVFKRRNGISPALEFLDSLNPSDNKKVIRLLKFFGDAGQIKNTEKFRLEKKPFFAFKSFQARLLCFFVPDAPRISIVITHGFTKKQDKLPSIELERANEIYKLITANQE